MIELSEQCHMETNDAYETIKIARKPQVNTIAPPVKLKMESTTKSRVSHCSIALVIFTVIVSILALTVAMAALIYILPRNLSQQTQLQDIQVQLNRSQEKIKSFQESVQPQQDAFQTQLQDIQVQLNSSQEKIESFQESVQPQQDAFQTQLQDIQVQLNRSQEKIESFQESVQPQQDAFQTQLQDIQVQLNRSQEKIESFQESVQPQQDAFQTQLQDIQVQLNRSQEKIKSFQESVQPQQDAFQTQLQDIQVQLNRSQEKIKSFQESVEDAFQTQLQNFQVQLNSSQEKIELLQFQLNASRPTCSRSQLAASCQQVLDCDPSSSSGYYWILSTDGRAVIKYCSMNEACGGASGGWMRVTALDMRDNMTMCPNGLREIANQMLCGTDIAPGCSHVLFGVNKVRYDQVCGKIIAYQVGSPDAFRSENDINQGYVDGISLTYGYNPREHIWTFVGALDELTTAPHDKCPCTNINVAASASRPPSFVGDDYFCDTGSKEGFIIGRFYADDPLWDGAGCGPDNTCCSLNNPPWFMKQLQSSTSEDIEMRVCIDEGRGNEDIYIEQIEIFVR